KPSFTRDVESFVGNLAQHNETRFRLVRPHVVVPHIELRIEIIMPPSFRFRQRILECLHNKLHGRFENFRLTGIVNEMPTAEALERIGKTSLPACTVINFIVEIYQLVVRALMQPDLYILEILECIAKRQERVIVRVSNEKLRTSQNIHSRANFV